MKDKQREDASEKKKEREKKKKRAMECRKQTRGRGDQVHGPEKREERISLSQNFIPTKSISLEYRRRLNRLTDIPK